MEVRRPASGSSSSPWGRRERRRVDQVALAAPAILPALRGGRGWSRSSPLWRLSPEPGSSTVLEVPEVILIMLARVENHSC